MEGFEIGGFEDESESAEIKLPIHNQKSLIYSMYVQLIQFEQHLDAITTKYKYMALTWTLACYAAIGYLLSSEVNDSMFSPFIGVIVACLIGIIGLFGIWHLDLNIYSKFWAVAFIEEVRMEKKFKFLLPSRNIELLLDSDRERIVAQGLLYLIAISILILTLGADIVYLNINKSIYLIISIGTIFLVLNFVICFFMFKTTKHTQKTFTEAIFSINQSSSA